MRAAVVLLVAGFAVAGCVSTPNLPVAEGGEDHHAMEAFLPDFDLRLETCDEAGGVSLYNMQDGSTGPVAPFRRANIQDDTGNPVLASYFQPIPPGGATTGIWHITVQCAKHAWKGVEGGPLHWGWVGVRIHPPPWDTSGIQRQYFVADFSLGNPEVVKELQAGGVHASRLLQAKIEWLAPMTLHTVLDDEDHGVFETHAKMRDYRAMEMGPMRFWLLVNLEHGHAHGEGNAGGKFRAVSFDLVNSGSGRHLVVDGTGWLSHTRTDAHGAVPAATGNVGGLLWTGFDRAIKAGPSPELTFNRTWLH